MHDIKIKYLQVGRGRLGEQIAQKYLQSQEAKGIKNGRNRVVYSRIDTVSGLEIANQQSERMVIEKLVICIAPGSEKKWQWATIFGGLCQQVKSSHVVINELIFISSTRVYDGYLTGVVSANDKPIAVSERAKSILIAESRLSGIANNVSILRCCGLVGEEYTYFAQLLTQPTDKVRFAIDISKVADRVVEILELSQSSNRVAILTDGYCYHNGLKLLLIEALELQTKHRLLRKGEVVIDNKKPS